MIWSIDYSIFSRFRMFNRFRELQETHSKSSLIVFAAVPNSDNIQKFLEQLAENYEIRNVRDRNNQARFDQDFMPWIAVLVFGFIEDRRSTNKILNQNLSNWMIVGDSIVHWLIRSPDIIFFLWGSQKIGLRRS